MYPYFKMPIDRDGIIAATIAGILSMIFGFFSVHIGWLFVIITMLVVYFFRDPIRVPPIDSDKCIVSPADGKIVDIRTVEPPEELCLKDPYVCRISIFLSVLDVHVNLAPANGIITNIQYISGKFFSATMDKSSTDNEREYMTIDTGNTKVGICRISGLIARRIRTDVQKNQEVKLASKIGIIRFGSRVEVYIPLSLDINVQYGQTTIAGETIIARIQ